MSFVGIAGTGRSLPENVVTNFDLSNIVDTNDEWISTRTGIKERRISKENNTSYYSFKAAEEAIKKAKISALDIDIIIVATSTPDRTIPSTACIVQDFLGAKNAQAFDISAACTGFIYALNIGWKLLLQGDEKVALIIGADVLSKIVNWEDRSTCVLFGDGAGAAIIKKQDKKGIYNTYIKSDGSMGRSCLTSSIFEMNSPFSNVKDDSKNIISMDGKEVFKFAINIIPQAIEEALDKSKINIDEIKYIVPHQANFRIISSAAKKLKLDVNKFYMNLDKYGNTSAASIPIALDEMIEKKLISSGDKIILVGFGGGLTWGAVILEI